MLTKSDLVEITKIVQNETRKIVQEELEPVKDRLTKMESKVDKLQKGQVEIKKDLKESFNFLDSDFSPRMKRVEKHLGLPPIQGI